MTRSGPEDTVESVRALLEALRARAETLSVAESLTGGRLAAAVTGVPGASAVFLGGVVSYATSVKTDVLGVDPEVVDRHGVVSAECARRMAEGVRDLLGSTWGVSTTGVAGPERQEDQPPGTVYVGLAGPVGTTAARLHLQGSRGEIQDETCLRALERLLDAVA